MAHAREEGGRSPKNEETIRKWYAAWEKKDWRPVDELLAENFTFTSAAGDDHISKSAFKKQCWATQIDFIARFDLQRVYGSGNEAFVCMFVGPRTAEFPQCGVFAASRRQVEAIECYFGAQSSFPSAVSAEDLSRPGAGAMWNRLSECTSTNHVEDTRESIDSG